MKTLHLKRKLSEAQGNKLQSKFLEDSAYEVLLQEDADVYNVEGELLLKFRKNVIPIEVLRQGYEAFRGSIRPSTNRGDASGGRDYRVKQDGTVNKKTTYAEPVLSNIVGYVDQFQRTPYCRKTAFTRDYFEIFQQGVPFVQAVDKLYSQLCPEHYARQKAIADGTNKNYVISDTAFTTVTVNKNFRTAVHKDAGDFQRGFGNLCVYREGTYDGLYFCLPEYGVAVDMQNTDVLFCDVHRWHGNTPLKSSVGEWLRVSFVMYYREYMITCKTPTEELAKVKQDRGGFLKL